MFSKCIVDVKDEAGKPKTTVEQEGVVVTTDIPDRVKFTGCLATLSFNAYLRQEVVYPDKKVPKKPDRRDNIVLKFPADTEYREVCHQRDLDLAELEGDPNARDDEVNHVQNSYSKILQEIGEVKKIQSNLLKEIEAEEKSLRLCEAMFTSISLTPEDTSFYGIERSKEELRDDMFYSTDPSSK